MPNINKVVFGNQTLIDLSTTTLSAANQLANGITAYDRAGNVITGTASGGGVVITDTLDSHGGTIREITAKVYESEPKTITANGTYNAADDSLDGYSSVTVNVPSGTPTLQSKTAAPSESQITITPDSGYDGLSSVTVSAISSNYVGTGIARRSSSDLMASGATITAPAGYYSASASKAIPNGSATAPASISGTSATLSTGMNTLTLSKSVSVTPSVTAGYVASGTAGSANVSLTATVVTKAAATINTSTTDQTISSGQFLTGTQTIKAVTVSGLAASNILSGVTVKVGDANDYDRIASVKGTVVIQHYYTGSSAPSSSVGSDGDIYLMTS